MRKVILTAVVAAALAAPLGCGDSNGENPMTSTGAITVSQPPVRLTELERATVRRMEDRVQGYCRRAARALAGEARAPTIAQLNEVTSAIDEVGRLAREKPTATLPSGAEVSLALGDVAENLEGSNCSPSLVAHIDQTLADLP